MDQTLKLDSRRQTFFPSLFSPSPIRSSVSQGFIFDIINIGKTEILSFTQLPQVKIARCTREQERLAAEYDAEEAMFAFVWLVVSAKGGAAGAAKDPLLRLDADKMQLTLSQARLLAKRAELERRLQGELRLRE